MTVSGDLPQDPTSPQRFDGEALAALIFEHAKARRLIEKLAPHHKPVSLNEAYAVQQHVLSRMGETAAGYKVELGSQSAMRWTGLGSPVLAVIPGSRLFTDGSDVRVESAGKLHVGAEIAIILGPPDPGVEFGLAVAEYRVAIKFSRSRFFDWRAVGVLGHVADNVGFNSLVLGDCIAAADLSTALAAPIGVYRDGLRLATGLTGEDRPDPFENLAAFAAEAARRGLAIRPGLVVTTGNLVVDRIADVSGLYEVRMGNWTARALLHA